MQLTLLRMFEIEDATIGILIVDGSFQCFTLEDLQRPEKIKSKTAIPTGDFQVLLTESPRFSDGYEKRGLSRLVPLVMNVPNYTGVRIHIGNKAADTDGCILVGTWALKLGARISGSTAAYKALHAKLKGAANIRLKIVSAVLPLTPVLAHPSKPLFEGLHGKPHAT